MLTPRKIEIFKAIVMEFVNTAEPVGSKTLIDKYHLAYSSATIRNEMSDLEKLGYLEKTHTSSGRVPSTLGYRFYVEHLMDEEENLGLESAIAQIFSDRRLSVDEAIRQSSEIVAQMTKLTTVVLGPSAMNEQLKSVQLIPVSDYSAMAVFVTESGHAEHRIFSFESSIDIKDLESCTSIMNERLKGTVLSEVIDKMEGLRPILSKSIDKYEMLFEAFVGAFMKFAQDEMYMSGERNMLYQPEFSNINKLREMMEMLEDSDVWRDLSSGQNHVSFKKNDQSEIVWLEDMAVISSSFKLLDDHEHKLMVVGPSRMEYSRVVSLMDYVSDMIETIYGKGGHDE